MPRGLTQQRVGAVFIFISLCLDGAQSVAIEDQQRDKNPTVVKIDDGHFGYSEITGQILQEALHVRFKVKRSSICDQSYSEFLSSVQSGKDEESGMEILNGIAFVEKFKNTELAPDLMLKCYSVEKGEIQVLKDKRFSITFIDPEECDLLPKIRTKVSMILTPNRKSIIGELNSPSDGCRLS